MFRLVAAGCALGLISPMHVAATISDADFNALKNMVQQMNGKLQSLEQTNQLDQQTIQQLQQHLTAAGITATNDLVAQAQERLANADPEVLWYFLVGSWAVLLHIGGTF